MKYPTSWFALEEFDSDHHLTQTAKCHKSALCASCLAVLLQEDLLENSEKKDHDVTAAVYMTIAFQPALFK